MTLTDQARPPASEAYAFDNNHQVSADHHAALAELLDPFTQRRIRELVRWREGMTCLEVGAGGGSVARWLAEQVGPRGWVVASDLKPQHLRSLTQRYPRLAVVGHDLTGPDPWPDALAGPFDLIHARLVLSHLAPRRQILHRFAQRLAPGGVLLVEDWAALRDDVVVTAPTPEAAELYQRYQYGLSAVLDQAGVDRTWALRVFPAMREEGLVEVETVVHGGYWVGGGPGLRVVAAGVPQLRGKLLADGLTEQQLDRFPGLTTDPRLVVRGHPLYSTSGRRADQPGARPT